MSPSKDSFILVHKIYGRMRMNPKQMTIHQLQNYTPDGTQIKDKRSV
jgi:hypothetical protein